MLAFALVFALAAVAASAGRTAPSLRAEHASQTSRAFSGTVVVVVGVVHEAAQHAARRVSYEFVDDATGTTHAVNWNAAVTVQPRQSTHGTLSATFDGTTYSAASFDPGVWGAARFSFCEFVSAASVHASLPRGSCLR